VWARRGPLTQNKYSSKTKSSFLKQLIPHSSFLIHKPSFPHKVLQIKYFLLLLLLLAVVVVGVGVGVGVGGVEHKFTEGFALGSGTPVEFVRPVGHGHLRM